MKCGKNFKFKKERSNQNYICSTYDTKGECERILVSQDFFLELIERRYQKEFTKEEIQSMIEKIEVKDKYEFVIHFYEDEPIVSMNGQFRF